MEKAKPAGKPDPCAHERAMLQSAVGDSAGAQTWVEKIDSPEERSQALLGMSVGLTYREQWKK
jgi:hypothetical protein